MPLYPLFLKGSGIGIGIGKNRWYQNISSAYRRGGNNEEIFSKLDALARVLTWFVFQASINACKLLPSQNYTKNIDTFQEGVLTPTQVV